MYLSKSVTLLMHLRVIKLHYFKDTIFEQYNDQLFRKFHINFELVSVLMLNKYDLQKI